MLVRGEVGDRPPTQGVRLGRLRFGYRRLDGRARGQTEDGVADLVDDARGVDPGDVGQREEPVVPEPAGTGVPVGGGDASGPDNDAGLAGIGVRFVDFGDGEHVGGGRREA